MITEPDNPHCIWTLVVGSVLFRDVQVNWPGVLGSEEFSPRARLHFELRAWSPPRERGSAEMEPASYRDLRARTDK